jgi:sulfatase maturation enzyme AslB (radical SAM superfamily)
MGCAHCLRGDSQNMDIDLNYIDQFLNGVDCIGNITFTGGEPSLNVIAIEYVLRKCQELGIGVGSFYIVTNGKENALELAIASLKWYAYCDDRDEMCGLALSKDMFHGEIDNENENILRGLSFFRNDKFTDFNRVSIISDGRAIEIDGFKKIDVDMHNEDLSWDEEDDCIRIESMMYLSANGDIRTNCDTSYDNDEYTIGNIGKDSLHYILQLQMIEKNGVLPF